MACASTVMLQYYQDQNYPSEMAIGQLANNIFLLHCCVDRTSLDSSAGHWCTAQPASQTILHVHVYPGG